MQYSISRTEAWVIIGEPTLGLAPELAAAEWRSGNRDRELCLHLLFLSWYCNLKPPYLTGYQQRRFGLASSLSYFVMSTLPWKLELLDDAEFLYVVGSMAHLTPYLLGEDEATWQDRSLAFQKRYRMLAPEGLTAALFEGRGAYGDYFAGQVVVPGGY